MYLIVSILPICIVPQAGKVLVNGYYFIVNSNGSIQHGQMDYKEDGDTLIFAKTTYQTDDDGKVLKAKEKATSDKLVDLKKYSVSFAEKANTVEKDELIENGGDEHPDGYTDEAYKNAVLGVYSYTGDEDTPMETSYEKSSPN